MVSITPVLLDLERVVRYIPPTPMHTRTYRADLCVSVMMHVHSCVYECAYAYITGLRLHVRVRARVRIRTRVRIDYP